jgi:osmoprotectant transport system ATP-binding protein
VATVPRLLKWERATVAARVDELLELVGLDPAAYRNRYPEQLSGGQRQRVGVARALGADPPVLLMDEPFGAVDPITRSRLQDELLRLQDTVRKTIVLVTHDVDEAVKLGDRIAVFKQGGILAQQGTPAEILGRPADAFVADFVGADRGLKSLHISTVGDAELMPVNGNRPATSVDASVSLADALSTLLLGDDAAVSVTRDGQVIGILTLDAVHAAARKLTSG